MTACELLAKIYAALPQVQCKRKCGGAYCGPIAVFPTERLRMEQAGFPIRLDIQPTGHCSFYDQEAASCRVHSVRPLICRLFGAANDPMMTCPHGCVADFLVQNPQVQEWIEQLREIDGEPVAPEAAKAFVPKGRFQ